MAYGVEMLLIDFPNCVFCGYFCYKVYRVNICHEYCRVMALELAGALFEVRVINQIHFDIDIIILLIGRILSLVLLFFIFLVFHIDVDELGTRSYV